MTGIRPRLPTEVNGNNSREISEKEEEIIILVAEGLKNKEIAVITGTTEHRIKNILREIYDKLGLDNRVQLTLWYMHKENCNASWTI